MFEHFVSFFPYILITSFVHTIPFLKFGVKYLCRKHTKISYTYLCTLFQVFDGFIPAFFLSLSHVMIP